MRTDRPDEADPDPDRTGTPARADVPEPAGGAQPARQPRDESEPARNPGDAAARAERNLEHRARTDTVYRAHAIDQAYERVREIERDTVTPAMRRIEAEDPGRHLAGLDHRLKGKDRLSEKVATAMTERGRTADQALATVKDVIRFTFCYPESQYADGVRTDCDRLAGEGFERVERRNSWTHEEYKGINSRWRVSGSSQLFEVQFHTEASFEAKQETHWAYERLRDPTASTTEQEAMSAYQRKVSSRIPIPPGASDIPDYRYP